MWAYRFGWWPTSVIGWLVVVPVAALVFLTLIRLFGIERGPLVFILAFTPYVAMAAVGVLILALFTRSFAFIGIVALCIGIQASWLLPAFVGDGTVASGDAPVLTVMNSNILHGEADPADIAREVRAHQVDLLAVEELTGEAVAGLNDAGLAAELPFQFLDPAQNYDGIGVWSRYPISQSRTVVALGMRPTLITEVAVPGLPLTFVGAHPIAPDPVHNENWLAEQALLRRILNDIDGPVVLAGDLNATFDHQSLRLLQQDGFSDAARQVGVGLQPTYPVGYNVPTLFTTDHIMVRDANLVAMQVEAVPITASDHLSLIVIYGYRA